MKILRPDGLSDTAPPEEGAENVRGKGGYINATVSTREFAGRRTPLGDFQDPPSHRT